MKRPPIFLQSGGSRLSTIVLTISLSHLCIGQYPVYYKIHLNLRTKLTWPSSPFHVETFLSYSQEYIPQHVKKWQGKVKINLCKMTFMTSRTR